MQRAAIMKWKRIAMGGMAVLMRIVIGCMAVLILMGLGCARLDVRAKPSRDFSIRAGRSVYRAGESFTLRVRPEEKGADIRIVRWKSSDRRVADVLADGTVLVREAGKCIITAKSQQGIQAAFEFYGVYYAVPEDTRGKQLTVEIQNAKGKTRSYTVFNQMRYKFKEHRRFLRWHGCSTSSLATLLTGYVKKHKNLTPDQVISKLEPKVFPETVRKRNYSKSLKLQRSISMYGMTKILDKYGIKHRYVYRFSRNQAEKQITEHLKKGKPVIITVRKGKFAFVYHTMLLIGIDEKERAIIADSADRKWSKKEQRVKYAPVSELLGTMWPCSRPNSVYWNGYTVSGGYVLVD